MGRKLRILIAESLIEAGAALRLVGWRVMPGTDDHPAFSSNGDMDQHFQRGGLDERFKRQLQ
jgi:hypothetical protein